MLTSFLPLINSQTRLLILGSFPGVKSLSAQQYYGHPQNHFWKILQAIWPDGPLNTSVCSYEIRSKWLLEKHLGLWDVYAACERDGSLDSNIRNSVLNDFARLNEWCPELQAIAHNGGESFKHSKHVRAALLGGSALHAVKSVGVPVHSAGPPQASTAPLGGSALHEVKSVGVQFYLLPSTSPANASWSFERKLHAWREVFEKHGLI